MFRTAKWLRLIVKYAMVKVILIGLSSRRGEIPDRRYSPQPAFAVESGEIPGADSKVWYAEDC